MKLSICFLIDSVEFTPAVIAGTASLGGSESAALGVARALQDRGHSVYIFSTKLAKDAPAFDQAGVRWCPMGLLSTWSEVVSWDVAIAVRMPIYLTQTALRTAKLRVLWNQDLMANDDMKNGVMSAGVFDASVYVSAYHRQQWEGFLPELAPLGWVTTNGFDPAHVPDPATITKDPNRIIHISRPERGLDAIMAMWPALRAQKPDAVLQVCRYSSMYDQDGWGRICADYDARLDALNAEVGGIERLGELGKADLYRAIATAAVMWYPGVVDFGETSCVAAIEAQACGTPFVGSFKGALPETVPAGVFIAGDAVRDPVYHDQSIAAVLAALDGCRRQTVAYREQVRAGRQHVDPAYTYAALGLSWEQWLMSQFRTRYTSHRRQVLNRCLHDDDHVMARVIAEELGDQSTIAFCDYVIAGKDHTAEQYGAHALDPLMELESASGPDGRVAAVVRRLRGAKMVLDVACGNGTFAIALALEDPERQIVGIDFSAANVEAAKRAAEIKGVADRVTFLCQPVWDFDTQDISGWMADFLTREAGRFDGLFCGEFLEHVANCDGLVRSLHRALSARAKVVWTCPYGPLGELIARTQDHDRGHVHHFRPVDLDALFGGQDGYTLATLPWGGVTPMGSRVGNWLIWYLHEPGAAVKRRPLERRVLLRPYPRITAGIICNDTTDLRRCLEHVWPSVDEIVLGNTGADPEDLARIEAAFPRKIAQVLNLGPVQDLPGGFAEARNATLDAATGEWFFWIDCDEILCGGDELAARVDTVVFQGYSIPQQNLHIDQAMTTERPIRLFRRRPDIRFYGVVHEQPQQGDCNGEIMPSLQIDDVQIAHTGYLHENQRRQKAYSRNLPLLVRDQEVFPDRELGKLLVMRDHANIALWEREKAGGVNAAVRERLGMVVGIYEEFFMDPAHKYHELGRPYYDMALREVRGAMEVELGMVARQHGLGDAHAKRGRTWIRRPQDLRALVTAHVDALLKPLEAPGLAVEPVTGRPVSVAPERTPEAVGG